MKSKSINFRKRNLLFVDLETTGLNPDSHEIIEVGAILVDGKSLDVISQYSAKIKPKHIETATDEAIKVSGYSSELWKGAKSESSVLKELSKMAPGAIIAGWKVDFDWWFLEHAFRKNKIEYDFDYHLIDVIPMAYLYFRKKKSVSYLGLRKVAAHFRIKMADQHDALGDIQGTYKIFKKLIGYYERNS